MNPTSQKTQVHNYVKSQPPYSPRNHAFILFEFKLRNCILNIIPPSEQK